MAFNYVETPRTEAGDVTRFTAGNISFSMEQPFPSPSKDPANDLVRQIRATGASRQHLKTPRAGNGLGNRKNEFTPLLKSAAHNRFRANAENKENEDDLLRSVLSGRAPATPAYLKAGYKEAATPGLPVNSSILDDEHTGSSAGDEAAVPPAVASSSLMSTPMPILPQRGQSGIIDQGNVLTLREQEAKLDALAKENFGLKLRIHFLDEHLKRSGTEYQQDTIKLNTELRVDNTQMSQELKKQKRAIERAEQEVEQYRQQLHDYAERVKKRHTDDIVKEEMERLRADAEQARKMAQDHERELEELRGQVQDSDSASAEKVKDLEDDVADLQAELRAKEQEIDEKDEEVQTLQDQLRQTGSDDKEVESLREDVAGLEAELDEKDQELATRDQELQDLRQQLNGAQAGDRSTKRLRGSLEQLENQLRDRDQESEELREAMRSLEKQLHAAESRAKSEKQQLEADAQRNAALLEQKSGELRALEERLQTARGSWDAEAEHTDARLQEKDRIIQEKESTLRDKLCLLAEKDAQITTFEQRMVGMTAENDDALRRRSTESEQQARQIRELRETLERAHMDADAELDEKDDLLAAKSEELQDLQSRVRKLEASKDDTAGSTMDRIERLEEEWAAKNQQLQERIAELRSLQSRLNAAETPSRKDALIRQQADEIRRLENTLKTSINQKEDELADLKVKLRNADTSGEAKSRLVDKLQDQLKSADENRSLAGHLDEDVREKQETIRQQENQILALQDKARKSSQESDSRIRTLEAQIQSMKTETAVQVKTIQQKTEQSKSSLAAEHAEALEALEDEIVVLESSLDNVRAEKSQLQVKADNLAKQLEDAQFARQHGTPVKERDELRIKIKNADAARNDLKRQVEVLEGELNSMWKAKESETPAKERTALRAEHRQAKEQIFQLNKKIAALEDEVEVAQQEKTMAEERMDLHEALKEAKIEAEDLQLQVTKREDEVTKLKSSEKSLRAQVRKLQDAQDQLQEVEIQLDDKNVSSSGHARREAELRVQLRDAKVELEDVQIQLAEKDKRIQSCLRKEYQLRERLQQGVKSTDDTEFLERDLKAKLESVETACGGLQERLAERDNRLQTALQRENELRAKLKALRNKTDDNQCIGQRELRRVIEAKEKTHAREIRGLTYQIQYMHAQITREENFRDDLVFVKGVLERQIEGYEACNKTTLRKLQEMGARHQPAFKSRVPSLKAVGLMVVAGLKMQKKVKAWEPNRKLHEALVEKYQEMQARRKTKA